MNDFEPAGAHSPAGGGVIRANGGTDAPPPRLRALSLSRRTRDPQSVAVESPPPKGVTAENNEVSAAGMGQSLPLGRRGLGIGFEQVSMSPSQALDPPPPYMQILPPSVGLGPFLHGRQDSEHANLAPMRLPPPPFNHGPAKRLG